MKLKGSKDEELSVELVKIALFPISNFALHDFELYNHESRVIFNIFNNIGGMLK